MRWGLLVGEDYRSGILTGTQVLHETRNGKENNTTNAQAKETMPKQKVIKAITACAISAVSIVAWTTHTSRTGIPCIDLFIHANVAHLAINLWVLMQLWNKPLWHLIPACAMGTIGIACAHNAVGCSAAVFALIGWRWYRFNNAMSWTMMAISLAAAAAIPQISFIAHAVPFFSAWALGTLFRLAKQYYDDNRRR